jgi:DNA-binding response OmpR family regulator/phage FluMu protein Com
MIIQCPQCKARYRVADPIEAQPPLWAHCPKCKQRFQVLADTDAVTTAAESPRVLLVDDALFFRELIGDILQKREFELDTADSARDAWIKLNSRAYDLLMIDINLPDMSGLKLIEKLRQTEKTKNLRILCISGVYRKGADAMEAIRAGADDFISKSFQPRELNERIDKLLKG